MSKEAKGVHLIRHATLMQSGNRELLLCDLIEASAGRENIN